MKKASPDPVALIVDPDPITRHPLTELVESRGFRAVTASRASEGLEKFHSEAPSLVLLDLDLPDMPGQTVLRHMRRSRTEVPIVALMTGPDLAAAGEATRNRVTECWEKSTSLEPLRTIIEHLRPSGGTPHGPSRVGEAWEHDRIEFFRQYEQLFRGSEKMRAVERLVTQVADTNATVLIQGETGVGKELVAKAIHYLSDRCAEPWLKVNCASLPPDLLESELFGHDKGAFTGATERKPGRFELAHGGTLLLDEIGEMPLGLQSKILHVLQDNEFFRIGGRELISVDVRVIAATNRNIQAMVGGNLFREDLYYRLNVLNIFVPPLRERGEEIPPLVEYFRDKFGGQFNRHTAPLSQETLDLLMGYGWPGNVRELENLIKRYVVLNDEGHLQAELKVRRRLASPEQPAAPPAPVEPKEMGDGLRTIARRAAREAEKAAIREVLDRVQWNRAEAARLLKVSYKTLLSKLNQNGFHGKPRAKPKEKRTSHNGERTT